MMIPKKNNDVKKSYSSDIFYGCTALLVRVSVKCSVLVVLIPLLLANYHEAYAQSVLIQSDVNPAKCFHKKDRDWSNGNPIHLWDCAAGGTDNKVWVFEEATGYIRSATNRDKCLHKQSGGWRNGNNIHVWDCDAGTNEMKTWNFDETTGQIRAILNPNKCLHKSQGGWANGNAIHIWDCSAGGDEMKAWDLASYLYINPDCELVNSLGPALAPQIREQANTELSGQSHRISRRKTFVVHSVQSVVVTNCRVNLVLSSTLQRKIRRDAHGTVDLSAQIGSISEDEVCLTDVTLDDVNLSRTGIIGESFYRWIANSIIDNNQCFPIAIAM